MEELAKHGISLPPNMQGLAEEQISELNLHDDWEDECIPSGGVTENRDPLGKRNGKGEIFLIFVLCTLCLPNALNVLVEVLFSIFNKQGGLFQQLLNFLRK